MIELQTINKILQEKDLEWIIQAGIDKDYFTGYANEFDFICKHYKKYKSVPDKTTFLATFPEFEFTKISEPNKYLIDKLRENHLYNQSVPIIQHAVELYNQDANMAVEYLMKNFQSIKTTYGVTGVDIIQNAKDRLTELQDKANNRNNWFFHSGFDELDQIINGLQRGEELIVLFARTNQGKSWIAEKMAVSVWQQGFNVGYFSPEMSANSVGYRFDTLFQNFSNRQLTYGEKVEAKYKSYVNNLDKNDAKFLVTTVRDFDRAPTISRLRNWIRENDLHMIVIDGLSYLADERYHRGDNTTTSLTNIAEDLMTLSIEMSIPIVAVVQANREAAGDDKTAAPSLETIRNSDGISHNASKVISLRNKNNTLELRILKQRNGEVGSRLLYQWDIDTGKFTYLPNPQSKLPSDGQTAQEIHDQYNDADSVF